MIDLSGTITPSQLAKELGVTVITASKLLKEVGGGQKIGTATFYDRESVKDHVFGKHINVLVFLGLAKVDELEGE